MLFDNNYELLHDRIDIKAVSPITDKAVDYLADSEGTKLNFKVMASAVATFRESGTVDETCFEEIRKDMKWRGSRK